MSLIKNLIKEPVENKPHKYNKKGKNDTEGEKPDEETEEEQNPRPIIRTVTDLQRLKLEKLMKNPEKPVIIPELRKGEKEFAVPSFVRNVMGSSAGAGSGEFHVYRHLRRKEYARQKTIQAKSLREQLDEQYQDKLLENLRAAEEKTAKKRAKRMKKKQRAKRSRQHNKKTGEPDKNESDEQETSEEEDAEEKQVDEVVQAPEAETEMKVGEEVTNKEEKSQLGITIDEADVQVIPQTTKEAETPASKEEVETAEHVEAEDDELLAKKKGQEQDACLDDGEKSIQGNNGEESTNRSTTNKEISERLQTADESERSTVAE